MKETEINATVEAMTQAFNQQDITGITNSYEDGAVVMFEPTQPVSDPEAITQMFMGAFAGKPQFAYPKGHEVYTTKDLALHIAPWIMEAQAPDGSTITQEGLSVAVLRQQADGQWRLVIDNPHAQQIMASE